jgi:hypothetical protein
VEKIRLEIDVNERGTPRAKKLIRAASNDIRFEPNG